MNFNTFGDLDAVASGNRRLAPWGIYKVKFMGARKDSIQGKADTSKTYDILKIRFEGEDGYYEESVFYPSDDKFFERRTFTNRDGHEYQLHNLEPCLIKRGLKNSKLQVERALLRVLMM